MEHEDFDKEQANGILEIIREKIVTQKESSVVSGGSDSRGSNLNILISF